MRMYPKRHLDSDTMRGNLSDILQREVHEND